MIKTVGCLLVMMSLLVVASAGMAEPLLRELLDLESGWAHFSYDSRPDLSGNCDIIRIDDHSGIDHMTIRFRGEFEEDETTFRGPVHLQLRIRRGELIRLTTCIGDSYKPSSTGKVVDFGHVPAATAIEALLSLVREDGPDAEDCILPAILARGFDRWPALLDLARDRKLSPDIRRQAIFWLAKSDDDRALGLFEEILLAD